MAKIPPASRLVTEDYPDQSSWIDKLLVPINTYFERNSAALNQGLTINDNFAGRILTVELDGNFPVRVTWPLRSKPVSVLVGDWSRKDGAQRDVVATTTGNLTSGSNSIVSVASTTGIRAGLLVTGTGIPTDTYVNSKSGSTVTISENATASGTGVTLKFAMHQAVQVLWSYNQNGQLQIDDVVGITPSASNRFILTLECKTG